MITEKEIINILEAAGIPAAEEYFPAETELPYAVVLTPTVIIDCPDMGGRHYVAGMTKSIRVELFTMSKADPVRKAFLDIMLTQMPVDGIRIMNESYGRNRMYLTAVEFDLEE